MNQRVSQRPWFLGLFAALGIACSSNSNTSQEMIPMPPMAEPPKVVFSEIMYHPVDEKAYDDNHEFLELYNRSDSAVDLSNWKLSGTVHFTFPSGSTIAPGGYVVLAKNKSALASIASYQLGPSDILGEYSGDLDNGGAVINLLNAENTLVESVEYHVDFPWPIGADGLGADDEWLARLPTPLSTAPHQYKGISLQRVNYELAANLIANWVPSPLDGASPGKANSISGLPPTIVERKIVAAQSGNVLIRSADTVKISVVFSNLSPFSKPQLEWFVDDLQAAGEPVTKVDLVANGGFYEATLPKQPNNSIVRYRILVDKGTGAEVISPRPSDPLTWWAYFVTPPVNTSAPIYHLFIKKDDWTQLYDNVNWPTPDDKRVSPGGSPANRCLLRDSWDGLRC